jgi:hypothetical protein
MERMRENLPMFGLVLMLLLLAVTFASSVPAVLAAENSTTCTVTIRKVGISVSPASHDFGYMNLSENKKSWSGTNTFTATNTGNHKENFTIKGTNATDGHGHTWTLASAVGADNYVMQTNAYQTGQGTEGSYYNLTTTPETKASSVDNGSSRYFSIWIFTPTTSTETYYQYSMYVIAGAYSAE